MQASGGMDIAEDILGALHRVSAYDWNGRAKFIIVIADDPGHGKALHNPDAVANDDRYFRDGDPEGRTAETVIHGLQAKDVDMIFCHIGEGTRTMRQVFKRAFERGERHRQMTEVSLVASLDSASAAQKRDRTHVVFCLDASGSMTGQPWTDLNTAYCSYLQRRKSDQGVRDSVSVIVFDDNVVCPEEHRNVDITKAPLFLQYTGGGTAFVPALQRADSCMKRMNTLDPHVKNLLVFMSDGVCFEPKEDVLQALSFLPSDMKVHCVGFGAAARPGSTASQMLQSMASDTRGEFHAAATGQELNATFTKIAANCKVGDQLMSEVGKRISDSVRDKLQLEYL